eukprot:1903951-Rhodomonas_salina.2
MPPKKKDAEPEVLGGARFGRVKNNLKMGIVGLPNVGKSSLFNLLTKQSAAAENFPFCTIDPNEARCAVPDDRYDKLVAMWKPVNEYPAYLQMYHAPQTFQSVATDLERAATHSLCNALRLPTHAPYHPPY